MNNYIIERQIICFIHFIPHDVRYNEVIPLSGEKQHCIGVFIVYLFINRMQFSIRQFIGIPRRYLYWVESSVPWAGNTCISPSERPSWPTCWGSTCLRTPPDTPGGPSWNNSTYFDLCIPGILIGRVLNIVTVLKYLSCHKEPSECKKGPVPNPVAGSLWHKRAVLTPWKYFNTLKHWTNENAGSISGPMRMPDLSLDQWEC